MCIRDRCCGATPKFESNLALKKSSILRDKPVRNVPKASKMLPNPRRICLAILLLAALKNIWDKPPRRDETAIAMPNSV
ncbi:MAG: hypothetical protein N3E47_03835 [Candidatus Bathyarchaeota archaeon]|nr:hypothetical protein [Candidatus Bathyarchaeota archaeon]